MDVLRVTTGEFPVYERGGERFNELSWCSPINFSAQMASAESRT